MADVGANGHLVPFGQTFRFWAKLGFINFGGPAGQIAIMHDELVERKRWISNARFLHALNFCMLLPGPEATQLAIYIGWLLNGTWGGIVAGILFVLPAFFLILVLSWVYVTFGDIAWVAAVFYGLRPAVIALVAVAVVRVGSRALRNRILIGIAVAAFIAIFFLHVPFPVIVAGAALVGFVGSRNAADLFRSPVADDDDAVLSDEAKPARSRTARRIVAVVVVGLAIWWVPLLAVALARGSGDTLTELALFFSRAAMVTFGGAYAVLAYINEAAVQDYGWLEPGQMVTGLGLAESTPGPLIMVTEFVGFVAGYGSPGGLDPLIGAFAGATIVVWATFAPCFLWIFLGAPYIERLRGNVVLDAALASVTAAVVGVILNLGVVFALATLFARTSMARVGPMTFPVPEISTVDGFALLLAVVGSVALWRFRLNVLWVIGGSALAGLFYRLIG